MARRLFALVVLYNCNYVFAGQEARHRGRRQILPRTYAEL